MRILCENTGNHEYLYGVKRVLETCGHKCVIWNPNGVPAFDIFDEVEPDIYMFGTSLPARAVQKCLVERPHVKTYRPNSAEVFFDTFLYWPGVSRPELAADVSLVETSINQRCRHFINRLIDQGSYNVKIYGNEAWDSPRYLGPISLATERDIYASSKLSIVVDHSHDLRITASGGLPFTVYSSGDSYGYFLSIVTGSNPSIRQEMIKNRRKEAYASHTYWHEVSYMLASVGRITDSQLIKEKRFEVLGL